MRTCQCPHVYDAAQLLHAAINLICQHDFNSFCRLAVRESSRKVIMARKQLNFCASLRQLAGAWCDPMQIIETRAVSLQAPQDVEIRVGLTLSRGLYQGTEERIRTDSIAGPSWAVKYKIAFTAVQLASIDPDLSSVNIDVTEFVRQGRLTICRPA
jgi:hypothetical protein